MFIPLLHQPRKALLTLAALASSLMLTPAVKAQTPNGITTVFYILLENRCFTSGTDKSQSNILFNNVNGGAPYITALCTPGSTAYTATYQGQTISQTAHSSYASCYHNAFGTATGNNSTPYFVENEAANVPNGTSIHPSEPQYVFMEAASNLSKLDDNDPYGTGKSVQQIANFLAANPSFTGECLSGLLQNAGISWTSYNEGTCLLNSSGQDFNTAKGTLTNNVAAPGVRTVPLASFSGTSASYTNPYNGSHQYDFACKHTGQLFFPATNGSTVTTANTATNNPEINHYAPLEQLAGDLASNTQAQYCVITPDQFNDGHTALSAGFTYHNYGGTNSGVTKSYTSDLARVGQMDSFCAILVPQIMASPVYQAGHAAIVIWTDETEGSPQNDFYHTLTEIVISPLAKGNGYNSTLNYTHSSDVATMQELFGVSANTPTGYLNDAANPSIPTPAGVNVTINTGTNGLQTSGVGQPFPGFGTGIAQDMADLFQPGVIPQGVPALSYTQSAYSFNRRTNLYSQTVTVTNMSSAPVNGPVYVLATNLTNATLANKAGNSTTFYAGSPYVLASPTGLAAGASVVVTLQFTSTGAIGDLLELVATGSGTP